MCLVIVLSDWGFAFSLLAVASPIISIFNFPEEISGFLAVWGSKHKYFQILCHAGLHTVRLPEFWSPLKARRGIRGQWDYIGTRIGIWTYSAPPLKPCSHYTTECMATCRERSHCAILSVKRRGQSSSTELLKDHIILRNICTVWYPILRRQLHAGRRWGVIRDSLRFGGGGVADVTDA